MTSRNDHVGDDLTALLDGALPAERRATVEAHLGSCEACRGERDRIARALATLAALPPPAGPAPGFEQRFHARLAREAPRRRPLLARLGFRPLRWLVPVTAAVALVAVGVSHRRSTERADLEMARNLDLLENYVEVASLGVVETAEDVDVVSHLDELEGPRP